MILQAVTNDISALLPIFLSAPQHSGGGLFLFESMGLWTLDA